MENTRAYLLNFGQIYSIVNSRLHEINSVIKLFLAAYVFWRPSLFVINYSRRVKVSGRERVRGGEKQHEDK